MAAQKQAEMAYQHVNNKKKDFISIPDNNKLRNLMASRYTAWIYNPIFSNLDPVVPEDDLDIQSIEPPYEDSETVKKCLLSDKWLFPNGFIDDDLLILDKVV